MGLVAVRLRSMVTATKDDEESSLPNLGAGFSWEGVSYNVGKGHKTKQIIEMISGSLAGGELCAILGPSGAGKTSLLNILAGRIRTKGSRCRVSGRITLNGVNVSSSSELRKRIAYVMQQDLLPPTQTPHEALLFSAMMRLPRDMPLSDKRTLVEGMLADLSLTRCADTYIGDDMIRGISGGEKKRTSIGIELVVQPKLIFLDEPTSGLDSYAAHNVIAKLRSLANKEGRNVLCTVHQPSSEAFHTFHKAMVRCMTRLPTERPPAERPPTERPSTERTPTERTPPLTTWAPTLFRTQLLRYGKLFFFGRIEDLSTGLASSGFGCPSEYNLADHAMWVIQTESSEVCKHANARIRLLRFAYKGRDACPEQHTPG